jgi:hypothetical protein
MKSKCPAGISFSSSSLAVSRISSAYWLRKDLERYRWHLDGHAAQARLLRAVGLRVLKNGPQVVIPGDDVIAVVGVGLEHRAGRARVRQDFPEPFGVRRVKEVKMGGEVRHAGCHGIVDASHRGLHASKPPTVRR